MEQKTMNSSLPSTTGTHGHACVCGSVYMWVCMHVCVGGMLACVCVWGGACMCGGEVQGSVAAMI